MMIEILASREISRDTEEGGGKPWRHQAINYNNTTYVVIFGWAGYFL